MPRTYKKVPGSREYRNYSDESLRAATEAVKNGMSIRKASQKFDVKRGTLYNKVKNLHMSTFGGQTILSSVEEQAIVKHLLILSTWGFPFGKADLKNLVKLYLEKQGRTVPFFKDNYPGEDWCRLFLLRHEKDLTVRMCQNISRKRASVDNESIDEYFSNLKEVLKGVSPENIINYDETNLTDDPGRKKCIFKRGVKYPERVLNQTKSSTSIMFAGTATGTVLPPYTVYKAEHMWDTWTLGGPQGARYNRTRSGWFDAACFDDWFSTVVMPYCKKMTGKKVLIGDNLSSHISETVIKTCEENNICFVCLPPNSTHLCQPLDVAYYGPMKKAWRDILTTWKLKHGKRYPTITKDAFPSLLKELTIKLSVTGDHNIISGFKKCGIFPLDAAPVKARLPRKDIQLSKEKDQQKASQCVSEAVIDMLSTLRSGAEGGKDDEPPKKKRRSRVRVAPGKSVTCSDLTRSENDLADVACSSEKITKDSGEKRKQLTKEVCGIGTKKRAKKLVESENESDEDEQNTESEESSEEEVHSETEQETTAQIEKRDIKKFDWIVVKFATKKTIRYFIGQVKEVKPDDRDEGDFAVEFLRKSFLSSSITGNPTFSWPEKEDICCIDCDQIIMKLNAPEDVRRGMVKFKERLNKFNIE